MYQLRWYQREACESAWAWICNQAGNPVISLPTGAGKSLVIAELCRKTVEEFGCRAMVLAHRKELLEQNADKISALLPATVPVGLYSAGLRSRDTDESVVVAGIQSAYDKAGLFGSRQLIVVDESHLVPLAGEGMYRKFLNDMRAINPASRVVGLTATPYRLDCGPLCRADGIFQRICYSAPIGQLIAEGHLCALESKATDAHIETRGLHKRAGEFVAHEVENAFTAGDLVQRSCREIVARAADRQSVLVFCCGVRHAEAVADCLDQISGSSVGLVTERTKPMLRAESLSRFRSGAIRFLVNVDVLTTGFDAPNIDCIAVLRSTASPGLFAQICGRGLRVAPNKTSCLILDFGQNIRLHGPLDSPGYGRGSTRNPSSGEPGETKKCPNCEQESLRNAEFCLDCGFEFGGPPREPKHDARPDDAAILSQPETYSVEGVRMRKHTKKNAPPGSSSTLRVDYECAPSGGSMPEVVSEWVCLEHAGYAWVQASKWWKEHTKAPRPDSAEEPIETAIRLFNGGAFRMPARITVIQEGKFRRVIGREFVDEFPEEWREEENEFAFPGNMDDVPF